MFRLKQNEPRTRGQLLREELGESFDHAVRAAGYAADGVRAAGTQVMPAASRMRHAAGERVSGTMTVLGEAADVEKRAKAAKAAKKALRSKRKRRTRRFPRAVGMLAAGLAVGAVGALVMRRRRQQQWAEYDPNEALEAVGAGRAGTSEMPGREPAGDDVEADLYDTAATEPMDDLMSRPSGGGTPKNSST